MIIKAKHDIVIYNFFRNYAIRKTNKVFDSVSISGEFKNQNKALLVIANHISWWDGFWIMYVNKKIFHRKFHFMMLEKQLKKYWFFNYCGGFSVSKNTRSVIETLNYTKELLEDEKNMVLIFPQGKMNSIYENNINFEKGIDWILKKTNNIQIVQVANFIDYFSKRKPSLYIYLEEFIKDGNDNSIQNSYQKFYLQSIEKQKKNAF